MSKEKNPEKPWFYHPMMVFGIPATSALGFSPPYTAAKQLQNNKQLGTTISPWKLVGLFPTMGQMLSRTVLRTGPVPAVQDFVQNNHPGFLTKEQAKTIGTIFSLVMADVFNTPMDTMATKQQTWKENSGLPKPNFANWWRESKSTAEFCRKLYGLDGVLKGAPMLGVFLRAAPVLAILVYARDELTRASKPQTLSDKLLIDGKASIVAVAANVACTPFSKVQQLTMRCNEPLPIGEALKEAFGKGIKEAYKGAGARVGVTMAGVCMTLSALTGQELFKGYYDKQCSQERNR